MNLPLSENAVLAFVDKVEDLSLFQDRIEKPSRIPQVWDAFREEIERQIKASAIALFLVDQKTHSFELRHWTPLDCESLCRREVEAQIECGTFAWIVNRRLPAVIPSQVFRGPQTLVMLPLATHARTLGVAVITTTIEEQAVTQERLRLLGILSKQCALVMENTLLYDQLEREHASLQAAQAQIIQAEKFAAFGRLTSGAFHELLNPLNIISGHLQLMMMAEELQTPWNDYLCAMKSASDRIAAIVDSLLKFSVKRISKGVKFDVVEVLRQLAEDVKTRRPERRVTIEIACEQDLPPLTAHEDDFRTVLRHLFNNAFDAMAEGGKLCIGVECSPLSPERDDARQTLEIRIADNGYGISESDTYKVFDPFFTTKPVGEGMGLSLAVSYALVCAMGGTLSFKSVPHKGTEFCIRLPL
jgi:signal transduction histidine kinase